MTARLELEALTLQMAGAAWVSIFIEVSSLQQREKQIAGIWGYGEHRTMWYVFSINVEGQHGVRKGSGDCQNTLGWVSKDKYSLLSAAYNLFDLRQATTEVSSKKKKIITGLTMKSFQRRKSKYREQGCLFS